MRVLMLKTEFKEGNTISLKLQPIDMDDNPDAFQELAEYALETDALAETVVEVHGKRFVAFYDEKAIGRWKPPVLLATDGRILQGNVILCVSYGMGTISGLSDDDEKHLWLYLQENIKSMAPILSKRK